MGKYLGEPLDDTRTCDHVVEYKDNGKEIVCGMFPALILNMDYDYLGRRRLCWDHFEEFKKHEEKMTGAAVESEEDMVNHPPHYTSHPSGVECIQITEHMSFNLGNALKYIWRADLKGTAVEDLEKAEFYIKREIEKRKK